MHSLKYNFTLTKVKHLNRKLIKLHQNHEFKSSNELKKIISYIRLYDEFN